MYIVLNLEIIFLNIIFKSYKNYVNYATKLNIPK